jgi:hypothetical protein
MNAPLCLKDSLGKTLCLLIRHTEHRKSKPHRGAFSDTVKPTELLREKIKRLDTARH